MSNWLDKMPTVRFWKQKEAEARVIGRDRTADYYKAMAESEMDEARDMDPKKEPPSDSRR